MGKAPKSKLTVSVADILDDTQSRGEMKRVAKWLEVHGDEAIIQSLIDEGRRRGVNLPNDASSWPLKKLIRRARGQEVASRRRENPIRRDEAFTCEACDVDVPAHGRTARNHCPACLTSKHVDVVPGDRQATCGGLMPAVGVVRENGRLLLVHSCEHCAHVRRNRVIEDGVVKDDWAAVSALSARGSP